MKLTRVENYSIRFGAAEEKPKEVTKPAVDDDDDEYEDESFWARNKGTIAALGAIGAAGVAIYAIRRGKLKNSKSKVTSTPTLDAYSLQRKFKDELAEAVGDKEVAAIIKKAMGHENKELHRMMLSDIICSYGSRKYINAESWETLFDAAAKFKPTEKTDMSGLGYIYSLVERLGANDLLTPEVFDKIITKISGSSDEIKVTVADRLVSSRFVDSKFVESSLSPEQFKKVIGVLNDIKSEKLNVDIGVKKEYNIPELLFDCHKKYFKNAEFDDNYVNDLREVLTNPRLSEDIRLQLVNDLERGKFKEDAGWHTNAKNRSIRAALDAIVNMSSDTYKAESYMTDFYGDGRKFVLGERLLCRFSFMPADELPAAEKLDIIDKLIASAERLQNNGTVDMSKSHYRDSFNSLLKEKLSTKRDVFEDMFTRTGSYDDIHKFVDDIQNDISQMNRDYAGWKTGVRFETEREYNETLRKLKTLFNSKKFSVGYDARKEDEIWNKINDFGKKTFGPSWTNYYHGYSGRYGGGYSGRSGRSSGTSSMFSKVEEAKQTLLKYLRQNEGLAELADKVENQKMDEDLLKAVKRKLSILYHPDKAGNDKELAAKNTEIYQEINDALDVIEKKL